MGKLLESVTAFAVVYVPALYRASLALPGWLVGFLVASVLALVIGPQVLLGMAVLAYIGSVWVALDEDLPKKYQDKRREYAVKEQADSQQEDTPDAEQ